MLRNYLVIAFRNLWRNRGYSFLNIMGYALGLGVFLLIALYVIDDLSYDREIPMADRIYRVLTEDTSAGLETTKYGVTSGMMMIHAPDALPEVAAATRTRNFGQAQVGLPDELGEENANTLTARILGADSSFFEVFPFEFIHGDAANALRDPNTIVITESVARKFFGDEDPIGKQLDSPSAQQPGTITAVIEDLPERSSFEFDIILPFVITDGNRAWFESWENVAVAGFMRVKDGISATVLEPKLRSFAADNGFPKMFTPHLQPFLDIHLHSQNMIYNTMNNLGDYSRTVALAVIGIMVLLVASVNFVNLATARAVKRAKEVGLRKTVGAMRSQLIGQYIGESVLVTFLSAVLAVFLMEALLPISNRFAGKEIASTLVLNPELLLGFFAFAVLVGVVAGVYPALFLSGFRPITVLKGSFRAGKHGVVLRQLLVVAQFAVSIALFAGVLVILQQIDYMRNIDIGFNREQLMYFHTFGQEPGQNRDVLENKLAQVPGVVSVGRANNLPGHNLARYEIRPEGKTDDTHSFMFNILYIHDTFPSALEIDLAAGRAFSPDFPADTIDNVMLNEAGLRLFEWSDAEEAVGRRINIIDEGGNPDPKRIVGVFKDFQYLNSKTAVEPMLFQYEPDGAWFFVRIAPGAMAQTVDAVEQTWNRVNPDSPIEINFMDDRFNAQFHSDRDFAAKVAVFSGFAILIACLGLFGLTSYATVQRRREIAVRKVLGSSESRIVFMLSRDTLKWVVFANLLAWPAAFFAIRAWLGGFAYKVPLTPLPFIASGLAALLVALVTVTFLTMRAARMNPTEALRTEV